MTFSIILGMDEEGDPVVLVFEYSLDGERWIRATVVGIVIRV